ncbi:hypothetical protein HC928_12445, partial [bacterium]|nr:hypothetical protein [bacterium]
LDAEQAEALSALERSLTENEARIQAAYDLYLQIQTDLARYDAAFVSQQIAATRDGFGGSGGTVFLGSIAPDGGEAGLSQAFIVNGSVDSGIYSLPITLTYQNPDGSSGQTNLRASVVVIVPPNLQRDLQERSRRSQQWGSRFSSAWS